MLRCAIVYTTLNDNARRLAESMCAALKPGECIYKGKPSVEALTADVIFGGNYAELHTPEIDRFLELAKHHLVVPFGYTCLGGGKDLCAIGIFARNVMDRAALIVQQKN